MRGLALAIGLFTLAAAPVRIAPIPQLSKRQIRARFPEAIPACSVHLASPVIQIWVNKCDRPSPGAGVELWALGDEPGTAIGEAEVQRIDELRAAGCPLAVLCTSSNEYVILMGKLSDAGRARLLARAGRLARPSSKKKDGAFLGIVPTLD